jgi:hypothetical protein
MSMLNTGVLVQVHVSVTNQKKIENMEERVGPYFPNINFSNKKDRNPFFSFGQLC